MKDVLFRAGELGIRLEMIMGDPVACTNETCRDSGMGTATDISLNEADTLGVRLALCAER